MGRILDDADRVYWWLRHHLPVAGALSIAFFALAVYTVVSGGGDDAPDLPASAVALVGDRPITRAELARWQTTFGQVPSGATGATGASPAEARQAAFELLAGSAWIEEEAESVGVSVTPEQVVTAVDEYLAELGATDSQTTSRVLQQLGTNERDLSFQQRTALLAAALQKRVRDAVPQPSAAQIEAAYTKEPQRWATPSERDARLVIAATEAAAKAARAELERGAAFADVVQKYSPDSRLSENGGAVQDVRPGSNTAVVERPLFAAAPGELTGPIDIEEGFMVFKVQKATPLPERSLEQATEAIKADLLGTAQATASTEYLRGLSDRWKARTRCASTVTSTDFCGERAD